MSQFDDCTTFILQEEGGYSNDPRDPGGPTCLGCTISTYSHEIGKAATISQMMALTPADVTPIYRKKYWNLINGDALAPGVDLIAFDIAVNMGVGRAMQFLVATQGYGPTARIKALDQKRRSFWRSLKTWAVFGKGWSAREDACVALALSMNPRPVSA